MPNRPAFFAQFPASHPASPLRGYRSACPDWVRASEAPEVPDRSDHQATLVLLRPEWANPAKVAAVIEGRPAGFADESAKAARALAGCLPCAAASHLAENSTEVLSKAACSKETAE